MDDQNKAVVVKETVEKFEKIANDCSGNTINPHKNRLKSKKLKWNINKLIEKSKRSIDEQRQNYVDEDETIEDLDTTERIQRLLIFFTLLGLFFCIFSFLHIGYVALQKTPVIRKIQEAIKVSEENSVRSVDSFSVQKEHYSFVNN